MHTPLLDRVLYFDGDEAAYSNQEIDVNRFRYVTDLTSDVIKYNNLISKDKKLQVKANIRPFDFSWRLPTQYLRMCVITRLSENHTELAREYGWCDLDDRETRLAIELHQYISMGLTDLLRALFYIVDVLAMDDTTFGIGRGSCTNSYLLFVLGIHDVDSHLYELSFSEFMKE
jgi:DNA polymerase III alpha subunit